MEEYQLRADEKKRWWDLVLEAARLVKETRRPADRARFDLEVTRYLNKYG